jgi:hypothetical protein
METAGDLPGMTAPIAGVPGVVKFISDIITKSNGSKDEIWSYYSVKTFDLQRLPSSEKVLL